MRKSSILCGLVVAGLIMVGGSGVVVASTLIEVKTRGHLHCGVSQGVPGFSDRDPAGDWRGLDVDFCRAVAAAVLGDAEAVEFTPLSATERFKGLNRGQVDLLARNTTWTTTRDTESGLSFAGVNFYDGQGVMMPVALGVSSLYDPNLAKGRIRICVKKGTTTKLNIEDFFRQHNYEGEGFAFETDDEVIQAYSRGRCDIWTADRSALAGHRTKLDNPDDHIVLPEIISKEPLGPVVRQGDEQWLKVVRWTLIAMLNAEELGVTKKLTRTNWQTETNAQKLRFDQERNLGELHPAVRRLLGIEGGIGPKLGLAEDWAYSIISQVGNYGEVYEANVGLNTPLKLKRGPNELYTNGGLHYGPPIR